MADLGTIMWRGRSGREYRYSIYQISAPRQAGPGNYILAEETAPGTFLPIYIGQSADLSEPLYPLEIISRRNRAVFIHLRMNDGDEKSRVVEADDLVALWNPPRNRTARPQDAAAGGAAIRRSAGVSSPGT